MKRDYIVTKSNKLIYANYDLSLNQQKIIVTLSSMVQPTDTEFKEYPLKIKDFMELLGITDQSKYKEIPKITKDLMKKVFEIREGNDILQLSWLASVRYKTREGIVLLKFAPDLKPYLLQLKELYTSYRLSNVLNLKSKYSIRLYEILKSNQYKKQKSFEMQLSELKKMMGAETSSYKLYANFKNRVLNTSNEELKEKTDIYFEYDEIKTGRKVVALKFYIFIKDEIAVTANYEVGNTDDEIRYICNICEHRINGKDAKAIYKEANKNIELIKEKYEVVKNIKDCKNVPGAIIDAIRDNWTIKKCKQKRPGGGFNNYTQRQYDAEELEKRLLGIEG